MQGPCGVSKRLYHARRRLNLACRSVPPAPITLIRVLAQIAAERQMRVAPYARSSTEDLRETSTEDPYPNGERYAERQGWTVQARYQDKAFSGAAQTRPGYPSLLVDAQIQRLGALLIDVLSCLSRDDVGLEPLVRTSIRELCAVISITPAQKAEILRTLHAALDVVESYPPTGGRCR